MKYILIIGDGMADYPIPELGNLTPLQVARKPHIDKITTMGRSGLLRTIPEGLKPGSDVAILSILGYDPKKFFTGRGPFEAATRGIKLKENDVAFRCNLITENNGIISDHSAGLISTKEAAELIKALKKTIEEPDKIEFHSGLDYRHFLILKNSPESLLLKTTPPHDSIGAKISSVMPIANSKKANEIATILREKILHSKKILESHPINISRIKAGKKPGNMIWPWSGGKKPSLESFQKRYGLTAAVISAVDLVKGIGIYSKMQIIDVPGATGLPNTNYEAKAQYALQALKNNDLVFIHVEAPDEAGHSKDFKLKIKTIEDIDKRLIGKILKNIKKPYAIAILSDHLTPCKIGTHTKDPVPFTIFSPLIKPDKNHKFNEITAKSGGFGLIENKSLISLLISSNENNK
ncbi:MAG: cofactor-independent phosphoglycerate mutase [Candidatus Bathyarchaeota archaeon]|nr:cofactor-independent phosphoglycerate mutase [Candidatus Bathyarchaeota archaeon]